MVVVPIDREEDKAQDVDEEFRKALGECGERWPTWFSESKCQDRNDDGKDTIAKGLESARPDIAGLRVDLCLVAHLPIVAQIE
jgi:hypothetical protein